MCGSAGRLSDAKQDRPLGASTVKFWGPEIANFRLESPSREDKSSLKSSLKIPQRSSVFRIPRQRCQISKFEAAITFPARIDEIHLRSANNGVCRSSRMEAQTQRANAGIRGEAAANLD